MGADLPALADMVLQRQVLPLGQALTTPHHRAQVRVKQHGVKLGALRLDHTSHGQHAHIGDGVQLIGLEVLHKDEVVLLAMVDLFVDGDVYLSF